MTQKRFLLSLLLFPLLMLSCNDAPEKKTLMHSKGLPSELMLVVDRDIWTTDVKDTILDIVEGQVAGLMQAEKMFRVTRVFSHDYAPTFRTFHTILRISVDPSLQAPITGTARDVNARPQLELVVAAPSVDQLRIYLSLNAQRIQDILAEAQLGFRVAELNKKYSLRVQKDLQAVLNMDIRVPENLIATKKGKNFLWGGTNTLQRDQNVLVYTLPWHGEDIMDTTFFVNRRDSVIRVNIPGERPDQWMQTVREKGMPLVVSRPLTVNGKRMLEVRGLWEMRNGALGGPFVALARVDTAESRIVVAEGWVYSPSTDKRDLLRQVEAALRTLH